MSIFFSSHPALSQNQADYKYVYTKWSKLDKPSCDDVTRIDEYVKYLFEYSCLCINLSFSYVVLTLSQLPVLGEVIECVRRNIFGWEPCIAIPVKEITSCISNANVLKQLYESCGGSNWQRHDGWCSDKPISEWHGVTVNERGQVIELNLSCNRLTGKIPESITQLKSLQQLKLANNTLSGSIPENLSTLQQLNYLSLHNNQLEGSIPKSIGQLQQLKHLDLSINGLGGTIPDELSRLKNLEEIALFMNQLTGNIPKQLGQLTKLVSISLFSNKLSGFIPETFRQLKQLGFLNLHSNNLNISDRLEKQITAMGLVRQQKDEFLWLRK